MHRVVICGAGFGGIATAAALRRGTSLGDLEIVLIDRGDDFVMGLRKTWAVLGTGTLNEGRRKLDRIGGVQFVQGEIEHIDAAGRSVTVGGRSIAGDALVLALGARHDMDSVPGLAARGINVWDRAHVDRARSALAGLGTGRVVVGIFGLPYSCPPAPFELALLARERLGPEVELSVFSPAPMALPVVGAQESAKVERLLEEQHISFLPGHQAAAVAEDQVEFTNGARVAFDVLLAVPAHRCPQVLVDAGLAEPGGWIKPDLRTLRTTHADVYAIGDCTVIGLSNGLPMPKAGIFAELEGEVVAARIAAALGGREPSATFAGEARCFLETGHGKAARAGGAFLADPVAVTISEPTADAFNEKLEFERSRLQSWFRH